MWAYPSRLMDAPRLGTSSATRQIWAAPPAYPYAPDGQTTPCGRQRLGGPCFAPCHWPHREIWAAPPAYSCAPNGQTTPCSRQVLGGPCFAPCPWTHQEIWAAPPEYPCTPNGQMMPCSRPVLGGLRFRGLRGVTWRRRKDFCTSFFLLWDFDVLTRTHGKENGEDGELGDVG